MPIAIPNDLPAAEILLNENIFVMKETRALSQEIRPLRILLLNLMPKKIETETQLCRLLGNTPLQVELELIRTKSHESKNTPAEHMLAFYKTFDDVKDRNFDGLVITGEHRFAFDITIPYNNRRLLELLLCTPVEDRMTDRLYSLIRQKADPAVDSAGVAITNLKHTSRRAKVENLYLAIHSRLPF